MACAGEAMTALFMPVYVYPELQNAARRFVLRRLCPPIRTLERISRKLVWNDAQYESTPEIIDAYDSIYSDHSGVWENQGRSRQSSSNISLDCCAGTMRDDCSKSVVGKVSYWQHSRGVICMAPNFEPRRYESTPEQMCRRTSASR